MKLLRYFFILCAIFPVIFAIELLMGWNSLFHFNNRTADVIFAVSTLLIWAAMIRNLLKH